MRRETIYVGIAVIIIVLSGIIGYGASTNDLDKNLINEKIKVEEVISGLNYQLSGYQSGRQELENQIIELKKKQSIIANSGNIVRYRKKVYETKKSHIDGLLGTSKETVSILPKAKAEYVGETEYERVRNQIIKLGVSYEIAEHITREAYANTSGAKEFVRNIIGVSNAESSIFQNCNNGHNNCLGVMLNGKLKHYDNLKESITDRRIKRNKNRRIVRVNASQWLKGNYCASECTYRVGNYNDAIVKLDI